MQRYAHRRACFVPGFAIALTSLAGIFYFLVWGVMLFPGGSLAGKAIWTATCAVAMGAVIGVATLSLVERRISGRVAIWAAAAIVIVVGSYCAWLCSRIDSRFEFFGGSEFAVPFILSGIVPAIGGGLLYGLWLYGRGAGVKHT